MRLARHGRGMGEAPGAGPRGVCSSAEWLLVTFLPHFGGSTVPGTGGQEVTLERAAMWGGRVPHLMEKEPEVTCSDLETTVEAPTGPAGAPAEVGLSVVPSSTGPPAPAVPTLTWEGLHQPRLCRASGEALAGSRERILQQVGGRGPGYRNLGGGLRAAPSPVLSVGPSLFWGAGWESRHLPSWPCLLGTLGKWPQPP